MQDRHSSGGKVVTSFHVCSNCQVLNPGHASSPIICGYNSGQHMFVPASDQCNKIQINIDTGTTTTTRLMGAMM